ncbi:MAG: amidohydrolase family protein [Pirellulaceae bacterium]
MRTIATAFLTMILVPPSIIAQDAANIPETVTLFKNVNIFDGTTPELRTGLDVLVVRDRIQRIAPDIPVTGSFQIEVANETIRTIPDPVGRGREGYSFQIVDEQGGTVTKEVEVNVIDGQGMTLMPGLIDSHVHFNLMVQGGPKGLEASTWEEIAVMSAAVSDEWLQSGFTTVRDMGGMYTGLRKAIDRGDIVGPRVYCCGGFISQTSGHGDFRLDSQFNSAEANVARLGISRLADGPAEVLRQTRENFSLGADYIKIMIGGGVSSEKDPLHSLQFTAEEIAAAVESCENWDTYVAAHVYHDEHVRRGLELGVMCFDHAQFITEDTCRLLKEKGAFISPNTAGMTPDLLKHPVYGNPAGPQYPKVVEFMERSQGLFDVLRSVKPKIVFNTDIVFTTGVPMRSHIDFEKFYLSENIGNFEALKAMTSTGGELAALTGKNNPYPGRLGVIEEGAYADILIVNGNPLEDMACIGAQPRWLDAEPRSPEVEPIRLIMKNGIVFKNTIGQ